jgi:hypothetical protein
MRWAIIVLFFCTPLTASMAQHHGGRAMSADDDDSTETLVSSKNYSTGGFGAAVLKIGPTNGNTAVFLGVRGGWVINKTFVIGGGIYGTSDLISHSMSGSMYGNTSFGYGGLELEYLIASTKLVHGSVLTHFGIGSFYGNDDYYYRGYYDYRPGFSSASFVFEPAANAELNILPWLRLALGVGYRFVTGANYSYGSQYYNNSSVRGTFGMLQIKFGPY